MSSLSCALWGPGALGPACGVAHLQVARGLCERCSRGLFRAQPAQLAVWCHLGTTFLSSLLLGLLAAALGFQVHVPPRLPLCVSPPLPISLDVSVHAKLSAVFCSYFDPCCSILGIFLTDSPSAGLLSQPSPLREPWRKIRRETPRSGLLPGRVTGAKSQTPCKSDFSPL